MEAWVSVVAVSLCATCVDRPHFDIVLTDSFPVFVNGFISLIPKPYRIEVNEVFDAESKDSIKITISVKRIEISDDRDNIEVPAEVRKLLSEATADGIKRVVGRVHKIKVELPGGLIYKSIPDSSAPGRVDNLLLNFREDVINDATKYGYDIVVNSFGSEDGNSLFQPVSGRIPSHFNQTNGTPSAIDGTFYATSVSSTSDIIRPIDVSSPNFTPQGLNILDDCLKLFPHATITRSSLWED